MGRWEKLYEKSLIETGSSAVSWVGKLSLERHWLDTWGRLGRAQGFKTKDVVSVTILRRSRRRRGSEV